MKSSTSSFHSDIKQIFGINIKEPNHYAICGKHLALVCGSYIIIYDLKTDEQIQFIMHSSSNISCIAATIDGTKLAVGESTKGSLISIYDLQESRVITKPNCTIKGHKYGASLMEWSLNAKYLVTVSNQDGGLFVWEDNVAISKNKMGKKIHKIFFTKQGNLITVGKQHFKIWLFDNGSIIRTQVNDIWMMDGKTIAMSKGFSEKQFISVAQTRGKIVALTIDGILCSIKNDAIEKAIDLQLPFVSGLDIFQKWAVVGGQNSTIKVIDIDSLQQVSTFPKPPSRLQQNIAEGQILLEQQQQNYVKCRQIKILNNQIICLYDNGTIFIWEIKNSNVHALRSFVGPEEEHVTLQLLQEINNQIIFLAASSRDNSIMVWHIYDECFDNKQSVDLAKAIGIRRNAYCKYLTRIINTSQVILHIKATQTLLIAASQKIIYVYSLSSYILLYQLPIDGLNIQALQANNNQLFVAFSNKTIKIFTLSETMLKGIKIIDAKTNVVDLKFVNNHLIVISSGSFLIVNLETDTVYKEEKDVSAIDLLDNKELYYLKQDKLHLYSLIKKKEKEAISLESEGTKLQGKLKVANNFVLLLSQNQNGSSLIRIWSHQGFLIHQKLYHELIQDITLCRDGHCIIANKSGSIVVEQFMYREKFTKVQKQFKRWFEENDLSWISGSIWISQDLKNKNYQSAEDLLISITEMPQKPLPEKFLNQSLAVSTMGNQLNVNIPYKNDAQRMSIFNPSLISDQVNKIISNVNNIQKKFQGKSPRTSYEKTINLQDPFEDINFSGQSKLTESLVTVPIASPVSKTDPKINNFFKPEISEQMLISSNDNPIQKQPPSSDSLNNIYQLLTNQSKSKQFIQTNQDKLKVIYQKLHAHFGQNTNTQTASAIQKLSQAYMNDLQVLLNKL